MIIIRININPININPSCPEKNSISSERLACVTAAHSLSEREAVIQASNRHISDESEKGNNLA